MSLKKTIILLLCSLALPHLMAQDIPHPVSNKGVYDFIDELANNGVIMVNSAVKPYSRMFIAKRLREADLKRDELGPRQQQELDFYLKDFGKELNAGEDWNRRKDLFFHKDSLFSLTVNPILGGEIFFNETGKATYWRNGAEARGYLKKWGFYASLRDNHEKPFLGRPLYLTPREGGHVKGKTDWSEMQGGVTYSWDWGYAGLVKEKQVWGNNYNGANILGGNNPTFIQFRVELNPVKWFSFNYIHGWLNSKVVDSADSYWVNNSYGRDYREVYHKKFISANMFTFTPFKNFNVSVGNSIIYSDENINPAYIVPVFFYKSVDHSMTSGIDNMNSQMYLDVSSRQVKHLHLYATMFIDELSVSRFTKDDEWNFFSWKAGFRLTDLPITNLSLTTEFTYTYPLTFQHYVPTLTFENAGYNLGHYMKDNSREWYIAFDYRPVKTMNINIFFTDAVRGPDYTEAGGNRLGNPPLESVSWKSRTFGMRADYQVINDLYVWISAFHGDMSGDARWSPVFFQGRKNNLNFGVTAGF